MPIASVPGPPFGKPSLPSQAHSCRESGLITTNTSFSLSQMKKMADFSFLSDDTDDSAVEELISQAQDLSVLEQISAINCSGFTDSVLPTELDTRFRKLKSFPISKPKSKPEEFILKKPNSSMSDDENIKFSPPKQNPEDEKKGLKLKSRSGSFASPSNSSNLSTESVIFSGSKESSEEKKVRKQKSRRGSFRSPLGSSSSLMDESSSRSPSPPSKSGCFFCSPKRVSKKKSHKKGNHDMDVGLEWGKDDEILSDLSIFSTKEQKRILKKAMKEEEKINREADKIVKWAKQASARMHVSDVEDELSDDDIFK